MPAIRIGTSGWSYKDWVGPFYEKGTPQGEFLASYSRHFDIVEVDSTFYRPPSRSLVQRWADHTPAGFSFALKVPRLITHDKVLLDCEAEMESLIETVGMLGEKLKALLLQFGYFNRSAFSGAGAFFDRLEGFLERFAEQVPLACEIRNRAWLKPGYFELLRRYGVMTTLVEHAWLPPIEEVVEQFDVVTGRGVYVRLIGDRKGIERVTTSWEREVLDRSADLARVAAAVRRLGERAEVMVFVNNHYAGHGPATCRALREAVERRE